jgi:hypothetical protein
VSHSTKKVLSTDPQALGGLDAHTQGGQQAFAFIQLSGHATLEPDQQTRGHHQAHAAGRPQPETGGLHRVAVGQAFEKGQQQPQGGEQHNEPQAVEHEAHGNQPPARLVHRVVVDHRRQHGGVHGQSQGEHQPVQHELVDGLCRGIEHVAQEKDKERAHPDGLAAQLVRRRPDQPDGEDHHQLGDEGQITGQGALLLQWHIQHLGEQVGVARVDETHHRDAEEGAEQQRVHVQARDAGRNAQIQPLGPEGPAGVLVGHGVPQAVRPAPCGAGNPEADRSPAGRHTRRARRPAGGQAAPAAAVCRLKTR